DLQWTLRSHGYPLTDPTPAVHVIVGDFPADQLSMQQSLPKAIDDGSGFTSRQVGNVRFSAPTQAGLYRVQLTVMAAGTPEPRPSLLVVNLAVSA
ncbi:MAG: hypothetical protein LC749_01110, partial [Actinobacteria bacterium]|nr:hypothetical protein [Actinomycetota bacterium]